MRPDEIKDITKFRTSWETSCLIILGQAEYNRTRQLPNDYTGIYALPCKGITAEAWYQNG